MKEVSSKTVKNQVLQLEPKVYTFHIYQVFSRLQKVGQIHKKVFGHDSHREYGS